MDATRTLPENYRLAAGFNLKDRKMLLIMNAAGLELLVLFGWLFTKLAIWLRPADAAAFLTLKWEGIGIFLTIVIVLAILFVTITVHEAIHGLVFTRWPTPNRFLLFAERTPTPARSSGYPAQQVPGHRAGAFCAHQLDRRGVDDDCSGHLDCPADFGLRDQCLGGGGRPVCGADAAAPTAGGAFKPRRG